MLNRPNVGSLGFKPSSTVDQSPASQRATAIVGVKNSASKGTVTKRSVKQRLNDRSLNLKRRLLLADAIQRLGLANTRKSLFFGQSQANYASKISNRERPDRRLRIG